MHVALGSFLGRLRVRGRVGLGLLDGIVWEARRLGEVLERKAEGGIIKTAAPRSGRTGPVLRRFETSRTETPTRILNIPVVKMGKTGIRTVCKVDFDKPASEQPYLHVSA
jgi:hypothetical protein